MQLIHHLPRRAAQWLVTLTLAGALVGVVASPAAAADLFVANDPCDLEIVAPGNAAGLANGVEAAPGTTVHLLTDGQCTPQIGPVFDRATGTFVTGVVAGNGPAILADGVTLDLNGHTIRSAPVDVNGDGVASDVFAECQTLTPPADCENAGVELSNKGSTITNLATTPSLVADFTTNFSVARAENGRIVGGILGTDAAGNPTVTMGAGSPSLAGSAYNLVGGTSHFGGALSLDKSKNVTVDTVWLNSQAAGGGDGLGSDLKRSDQITVQNSRVEGDVAAMRWKQGNSFYAVRNSLLESAAGTALLIRGINDSGNVGGTIFGVFGNVIRGVGGDGISVAQQSRSIPISGNTIQDSTLGCGLTVSLDSSVSNASNVVVTDFGPTSPLLAGNTFLNNGTNLCRR